MADLPLQDIVTGEEADCVNCRERIYAVIDPYSGCVDWGSALPSLGFEGPHDFGCARSPLNDDEGTGGHEPGDGHTPNGFKILIDSKSYWERIAEREAVTP